MGGGDAGTAGVGRRRRRGDSRALGEAFDLIPLNPKKTDSRYRRFVAEHGSRCAELDALPATELRRRVEEEIAAHIDLAQWERLREVERLEKETVAALASAWPA